MTIRERLAALRDGLYDDAERGASCDLRDREATPMTPRQDCLVVCCVAAFYLCLAIGLLLWPEARQELLDIARGGLAHPSVIWLRATVGDATLLGLGVFIALAVVRGLIGTLQDERALKKYRRDYAAHLAAYPDLTTPEARAAWSAREERCHQKAIRWERGFKRLGVVALGLLALMLWALDLAGLIIFGLIAAALVWVVRWVVTGFRADPQ